MTYQLLNLTEFAESLNNDWGREILNLIHERDDMENQLEKIRDNLNLPFPHTMSLEDRALEVTTLHDDVIEELECIGLLDYGPAGTSTATILRAVLGALTEEQIDNLLIKSKQEFDL